LDMETVIKYAKDVAAGMSHLEAEGICHRDLAARNLLLTEHQVVKIADFGMSRVSEDANQRRRTESNVGPLKWMSPEALSKLEYSSKSDVWSFGCVIIEMLTSKDPFPRLRGLDAAVHVMDGHTPEIPEDCGDKLKSIVQKCFAYKPEDRPDFNQIFDLFQDV